MGFFSKIRSEDEKLTESKYKLLADGEKVKVEILDFTCKTSSKGDEYLNLKMKASNSKGETSTIFQNFFMTEKAKWTTVVLLKSCGIWPEGTQEEKDAFLGQLDPSELIGKLALGVVGVEEYTGNDGTNKKKNNIKKFLFDDHIEVVSKPQEDVPF